MSHRSIEFLKFMHLKGPSLWTYQPALEVWCDIGELEDCPSNTLPGFYERLSSWLPGLIEHRCTYGERGGFLRRLQEGTWPCHILEHVTLELQTLIGLPGGFGKAREAGPRGVYKVVVTCWNEKVTRAALTTGRDLIMAAIDDTPFDVAAAVEALKELNDSEWLGPSTASIVQAADERRIPAVRLNDGNLVQLGYGAAQRRIWTAETDRTSAIAEGISRDKDLTKRLLAAVGVPVPEGRVVESADDAWEAAQEVGLPVAVKPTDGNHGRGVFVNLSTREEITASYHVSLQEGSGVIVERYVPGHEHRVLVVGGKVVAAAKGDTAVVTGNGRHTIRELIDLQLNSDPRRGTTEDHPLNYVKVDSAAALEIARQGFTPESVPPEGRTVLIARHGSLAFDVTDAVHPSIAAAAVLAARVVGLDIAGVDMVCEDIGKPLAMQKGAIVEVNAGPGLLPHLKPAVGESRPVGRAIVDHLFPGAANGRIPIVGVTGSVGKTAIAKMTARLLAFAGMQVGLACSDGLTMERRTIERRDCANWESGQRVLKNRATQAAVIENGFTQLVEHGLSYDRCTVGIVNRIDPPRHLGQYYMDEPEHVFKVLRSQIDVVLTRGAGVLNADDPMAVEMAELCDGEILYFALSDQTPALVDHVAGGGRAVTLRDGAIVLVSGSRAEVLAPLAALPAAAGLAEDSARLQAWSPAGGDAARWPTNGLAQLENALAAIAAAWALGLSRDTLRAGIETFESALADAVI